MQCLLHCVLYSPHHEIGMGAFFVPLPDYLLDFGAIQIVGVCLVYSQDECVQVNFLIEAERSRGHPLDEVTKIVLIKISFFEGNALGYQMNSSAKSSLTAKNQAAHPN